jgi:two-component system NtrC family response regulator
MEARKIILLVDDSQSFIDLFMVLPEAGAYDIIATTSAESALEQLKHQPVDLLISDVQMPNMDGIELFERARDLVPEIPVILITAYGSTDAAVDAVKRGAFHYFEKPLDRTMELFWTTVREALDKREMQRQVAVINRQKAIKSESGLRIIGKSEATQKMLKQINEVADLPVTVLIQGETGTGKELVAKAIHELGRRRDYPFFGISCTELSPGVLESELFGHERGSFTGAIARKKGLFEVAHRGTLFLDEISEAPAALQSKLLRVLETRTVKRIGGVTSIPTDFRVLAATNRDLETEAAAGRFRPDLLFRLNVYNITIPPLRERREDIPLIAQYYRDRFNKAYHRSVEGFSESALLGMKFYDWPGNVRELVNVVERAVITVAEGVIRSEHLPFQESSCVDSENLSLKEMERFHIQRALKLTGGNQSEAAHLLGIVRKTLREKLRKYDIDPSLFS